MRNRVREIVLRSPWLGRRLQAIGIEAEGRDWTGARNFLLSLLLLGVALLLALNGAMALERGQKSLMILLHTVALGLTAYVAIRLVPELARGTPLRWFFYQVDYQVTREGALYLAVIFVLILAAVNTGNNLLFIILASLLAGILVSGIVSRVVLTGVELNLDLPDHIFARQPVLASLTLLNHKRHLPSFSLTILGRSLPSSPNPRGTSPEGSCQGRILAEPVYFPYLPGGKSASQQVPLAFPRRGRYRQNAFQVSSKFPFGFLLKLRELPASQEVLVYPPVEPTEEFYEILPLLSGEMESPYRGRGHDLYSIRGYQPTDSARSVDWKATAKTQGLKVREFTREDERRVELVFDPHLPEKAPSAEWESRFERGVSFCACLAWHFYEIAAEMKFRSPDFETPLAPATRIIYDVLRELALIEPRWTEAAAATRFLTSLGRESSTFKVVLTAQPRGSIPTDLWTSAYVVFLPSL